MRISTLEGRHGSVAGKARCDRNVVTHAGTSARVGTTAGSDDDSGVSTPEPHQTDTTDALSPVADDLERVAKLLDVKSVLVMRSDPDQMVVAATAGEATRHYAVGGAGAKAGQAAERVPLYCERVVDTDDALFVRDSREDATFAGNEDEKEFGLHNYLGLAVHDADGAVVGTVCVLDDKSREYTAEERAHLESLRADVERIVAGDENALG